MGSLFKKMGATASQDSVSREDLDFIRRNTSYDKETVKTIYKAFKTETPAGLLNPAQFKKMYSECFYTGDPQELCDHVFRTFDIDKNGYIDFKEFILAMEITSSETPEDKLHWTFRMCDIDENGWVDLNELTTIVKSIYRMKGVLKNPNEGPEERAAKIFKQMDVNSDGRITIDEFVSTCSDDLELMAFLDPPSIL